MSSTRIGYDTDRMKINENRAFDSLNYLLNVPGCGSKPDFIEDPHIRLQHFGANISKNIVDINSDLKGINNKLSPDGIIIDNRDKNFNSHYSKNNYHDNSKTITDETRSTMPAWQIRDLEQNNWDFLHNNPQQHAIINFKNNIDSRRLDLEHYNNKNNYFN